MSAMCGVARRKKESEYFADSGPWAMRGVGTRRRKRGQCRRPEKEEDLPSQHQLVAYLNPFKGGSIRTRRKKRKKDGYRGHPCRVFALSNRCGEGDKVLVGGSYEESGQKRRVAHEMNLIARVAEGEALSMLEQEGNSLEEALFAFLLGERKKGGGVSSSMS